VYTQDDLRLLNIISSLAAVSVENSMLYQRMNDLAITDGLTGLYVQRYFRERLDTELKRALSAKRKFSLLMIDLDHFKDTNDKYGHTAGDTLLVKIAQVLKNSVSPEHIVSRYGGEEFAIFLFETDKSQAAKIAENIRTIVARSVFTLRRQDLRITISVGISSFPDDGYLAQDLIKKADENLYKAKQGGRNRIAWSGSI
jgi:diguanylate cyclase (GGDEF)-like protein